MSDPRRRSRSRPRWPYVLATLALFVGFVAVWALAAFGLETCGEDSHITPEEYARLCEPGGRIARNLTIIAVAAAAVTLGLGAAAIRRRAARPVLILTALLTIAGAAALAADRL